MLKRDRPPTALLIQPPVYDFALYDLFFKPYGLLRIGRWLETSGWQVRYLNALDYRDPATNAVLGAPRRNPDGTGKFPKREAVKPRALRDVPRRYSRYGILPQEMERRIALVQPDLVLLTSQMTYWYPGVAEAAAAARRSAPQAPLAVGGVYAALMPEHCRGVTGADAVFAGRVEKEFPAFCRREGLPEPRGPLPGEPLMRPGIWEEAAVVRLNRGCPYSCDYCASSLLEPGFAAREPEELFGDLERLHRRYGTRNVAFYDDALLVNKEQGLLPLLEMVIRSGMELSFYTPNAVHLREVDAETAQLMHRAGFQEVRLGYETADEEFHRRRDRKYTQAEVHPAISALKAAGFSGRSLVLYVLAGLPGQAPFEVEETIRRASAYGARVSVAEYSPVPGTAMWAESVRESRYDLEAEPLYHNNTLFPLDRPGFDRRELERLKRLSRVLCAHRHL
jgi:radical SAM superfamily enzyme YgiQ (UPF0313 family)